VALLEQRLAREKIAARVVNASISGDTTSGGRSRLPALLAREKPTHVVIELGGNDALRGLPLAMTEDNLAAMTQAAQAAGARVLLVGMQVPPNYGTDYAASLPACLARSPRPQGGRGAFLAQGRGRRQGRHCACSSPTASTPGKRRTPSCWTTSGPNCESCCDERAPFPPADAVARLDSFSAIIDARSEDEFALDHLPGAVNWPSLNNEERKRVGTHVQAGQPVRGAKSMAPPWWRPTSPPHRARRPGQAQGWQPLVYCWRGGKRSGSLALVLGQIGFKVTLVEGGYKAFRGALLADMPRAGAAPQLSRGLRPHRLGQDAAAAGTGGGGRPGAGPGSAGQPPQLGAGPDSGAAAAFAKAVRHAGVATPAQLRPGAPGVRGKPKAARSAMLPVPDALIAAMRASPCLRLDLPDSERVALLLEDYDFFVRDRAFFCQRLDALVELRGKATVQAWKDKVLAGDFNTVVRDLLSIHYDPGYERSMRNNFVRYADAVTVAARSRSMEEMERLARDLLQAQGA
jgi:tRNA 2-selenouridine synthase